MKKLIASLIITATALSANAADSSDVIGALIIGGILGSTINDNSNQQQPPPRHVYPGTQNYPIYVPSPVYTPPRTWSPNPVYELLPVYDSYCNCHVLMPVRVR